MRTKLVVLLVIAMVLLGCAPSQDTYSTKRVKEVVKVAEPGVDIYTRILIADDGSGCVTRQSISPGDLVYCAWKSTEKPNASPAHSN